MEYEIDSTGLKCAINRNHIHPMPIRYYPNRESEFKHYCINCDLFFSIKQLMHGINEDNNGKS